MYYNRLNLELQENWVLLLSAHISINSHLEGKSFVQHSGFLTSNLPSAQGIKSSRKKNLIPPIFFTFLLEWI